MPPVAMIALAFALVAAVSNWYARARLDPVGEYITKPLTMAALIVFAATLIPLDESRRWFFVGAAVLSLAGDVFLMLPKERFIAGLGSFLLAHALYTVGFLQLPVDGGNALIGAAVVIVAIATVGARVLRGVRRSEKPALRGPVAAYLVVISTMVVAAFATGPGVAMAGALLFYASDSIIAEDRFVQPRSWAPVAIMVTYHLGQMLLILSLTTTG